MVCVTVIDDDPSDLQLTTRLLQASGFRVAACASVEQLIREMDPAAPGCLLVDLTLRGVDGLALQRALSEARDYRPIIFTSRHADIGSAVAALKAGAVDFLPSRSIRKSCCPP